MSYTEYYDLYEKCQDYAPYHLFVFDVVGSKQISQIDDKYIAKISLLIDNVYKKIEEIEKQTQKQILHRGPCLSRPQLYEYTDGYSVFKQVNLPKEKRRYQLTELNDPFQICGDTIGLTILRDTLTEEEVYNIFDQTKEKLNISYDFHYANCYYETDEYSEGGTKFYRGYAIPILANQHKKQKRKVKSKNK